MTTHPTAFGLLLRGFRGRAGLTQEALAARAGLSVQAVTKLERGIHCRPQSATVHLLARALTLSPRERAHLERAAHQRSVPSGWRTGDDPAAAEVPPAVRTLLQTLAAVNSQRHTLVDVFISPSPDTEVAREEEALHVIIV